MAHLRRIPRCRIPAARRTGGYVLVMTLALLVLLASLLVGISRAALRRVVQARQAQDDLQRRWGEASCREAVLPYAEQILAAQESRLHRPVPTHRATVALGGRSFDVIVADEQAKANVNVLLGAGAKTVESRLRQSLTGSGLIGQVRLRPALAPLPRPGPLTAPTSRPDEAAPVPSVEQWITGPGQIFEPLAPQQWLGQRPVAAGARGASPADLLTCWGPGPINVRRASAASLGLVLGDGLMRTDLDRLIDARNRAFEPAGVGGATIAPAGKRVTLAAELQRARALLTAARIRGGGAGGVATGGEPALVDGSACHSVWIIARDRRRTWYSFTALNAADPARPRRAALAW